MLTLKYWWYGFLMRHHRWAAADYSTGSRTRRQHENKAMMYQNRRRAMMRQDD